LRQIARMWSVPYATFRKRVVQQATLNNHQHRSGRPTVLSMAEEQQLAEHIRALASAGFPCSRKDVRGLAFEYGKRRGYSGLSKLNSSAGYAWFKGFMKRHTNLTIKKAENLSIARAMSMNRVQITNWFRKYKNLCSDLGLTQTPSHIWNVDETGCQNIHKADKVLGEVGKAVYNVTAVERGETSTALVCINAVGSVPPPMIIHKGKQIGKQWKNGARHGVMIRASDSGYINKELFTESTAITATVKTPCTACHVFYGDASDPLKCDAWSACALCGNWYHVTCAENHGVIDDGDSFFCRSCL
jgi:transposase